MGDILIVTITPDRFVHKGPNRPAFKENLRIEAIAALDVVDYVAINEWPTAIETIKAIKPDLYVKGPDYKNYKQDVTGNIQLEEEAVKSVDGIIAFTSGEIYSSSSLINKHIRSHSSEQKRYISAIKEKYSIESVKNHLDNLNQLKVL